MNTIKPTDTEINQALLAKRVEAFNRRPGPRVGDYLRLDPPDPRCPSYTRFTHDWGDSIQTGGIDGSYYFSGRGFLSYSGGLDPGLSVADILPSDETKPGSVWFFDQDISGAGRGVYFTVPMRVFRTRPGADLGGIYSLHCPYSLSVFDQEQHDRSCGHWFTVTRHTMAHNAFQTEAELRAWLRKERLALSHPINTPGYQRLAWPGLHWCATCATNNAFVNQCRCDPNNLPTTVLN